MKESLFKLWYVANIRFPTEKAHGIQIMKMCEAFMHTGGDVRLVVPARRNTITDDPFSYYGIKDLFPVTYLSIWDTVAWGRLGFLFESLQFSLQAARFITRGSMDVVYGRDELVIWLVSMITRRPIVWESHTGAWNFFAKHAARRAKAVVVITQGLKDFYVQRGVSQEKIIVAHDGVDVQVFADQEPKEIARKRLGIPLDKKIALYIGRVDGWKGANIFFDAARFFPADVIAVVIGGEKDQVEVLRKKYPEIIFLGYRPYRELQHNQSAGDVLVLPNTGKDGISALFTSPLKLFSYMTSGRPIVVSDLQSVREILNDDFCFFVHPDDPYALAQGIARACDEKSDGAKKAMRAKEVVVQYDWNNRAKLIISFLHLI